MKIRRENSFCPAASAVCLSKFLLLKKKKNPVYFSSHLKCTESCQSPQVPQHLLDSSQSSRWCFLVTRDPELNPNWEACLWGCLTALSRSSANWSLDVSYLWHWEVDWRAWSRVSGRSAAGGQWVACSMNVYDRHGELNVCAPGSRQLGCRAQSAPVLSPPSWVPCKLLFSHRSDWQLE